jgi:hypothetical protein
MAGMKNATMRIAALVGMSVIALAVTPVAEADPPLPDGPDYPLAAGNYTTEADPGWVYFVVDFGGKPSDYHDFFGCGIGPDGTVGCDRVPDPGRYPSLFATYPPPGANQTAANFGEEASYRFSFTPTFTRDVDVLPEGRQLVNGNAKCRRGLQGSMSCRSGEHGFVLSTVWGENW